MRSVSTYSFVDTGKTKTIAIDVDDRVDPVEPVPEPETSEAGSQSSSDSAVAVGDGSQDHSQSQGQNQSHTTNDLEEDATGSVAQQARVTDANSNSIFND